MYHARLVVHDDERASGEEQKELQAVKDGVKTQWMENWFDGLTYCKHHFSSPILRYPESQQREGIFQSRTKY